MTEKEAEKSRSKKDKKAIIEEKYGKDYGIESEEEWKAYLQKLEDEGWWGLKNFLKKPGKASEQSKTDS